MFLSSVLTPTGFIFLTASCPRALPCSSCGPACPKPVQGAVPEQGGCRAVASVTPDACPGGSGAQTTHSFRRGHPADGNCWSLEWGQGAGDERLPGLLMNHSPRRHLGPLQHKLYLHPLKALGRFIEAAVLSLPAPRGNVTVNICLGGMCPAGEGLFCGQGDSSSLVPCSPCCWRRCCHPPEQRLSPGFPSSPMR